MMSILERLAAGTTAKATKETDLIPADEIITAQRPPQSLPGDASAGFVGNEDGEIDNLERNVGMGTIEDDVGDDGSTAAVATEKQRKEKIMHNNSNAADADNDESLATETINNKVAATAEIAAAIIDGTGGDVAAGVTNKNSPRSDNDDGTNIAYGMKTEKKVDKVVERVDIINFSDSGTSCG